ncbi:MAG: TonB-dependent receptor [Acidobacteria bacterium]|nr:TonB-dependent receptor [Acidobacteriota bacterium]NIM62793.1 TonB-dependent receptor [Acidobacteriota bacterium]NIO60949.1 TonB-dependent receptor [Acidobacteriota bacterium]NIQ31419.1 TonB-dependent receptor [Acidobacteriota bacterium]NIQ87418.1 TonB-dependent receptor [Acidobacteriota bacterium]
MAYRKCSIFFPVFIFLLTLPSSAADEGTIHGRVTTSAGDPALDVRVVIVELNRSLYVDAEGRFEFAGVPFGDYHVQALSPRFGSTVSEVTLGSPSVETALVLGQSRHRERVVVTATRSGRGSAEVIQPVNVLDKNDLAETIQPSLGETLAQEAGIRSSFFGAGSARPIVRGQSGGRVRVLESGLGVGDASTTSPDHAVAIEPLGAEQIEILRGPATLLYGGEAVGGVVNVLDGRIPEYRASKPIGGTLQLGFDSASDERSGAVALNGGGGSFAWYADAFRRDGSDYDIPGFSVRGDPLSDSGTLTNSSVESDGGSLGLSWVGESGFLGVATKAYNSNYGIPGEDVRIDLEQQRYDLRGGFDFRSGALAGLRFSIGTTDYRHVELEGTDVGTVFDTDADEARIELTHGRSRWKGVFGAQVQRRDVDAIGAEAFLPANETEQVAVFVVEEFDPDGPVRFEFGLRSERNELSTPVMVAADPLCADPLDRDFDTLSGSAGLAWIGTSGLALGASVSSASRAPSTEELYSCGEHVATLSFEVGNPSLSEETALGLDLSLRKRSGRVSGEINLFHYDYDDYIYEFDTGTTEPPMDPAGLPVFAFTQDGAEFSGVELSGLVELKHTEALDLDLEIVGDHVRAKLDSGDPVPRIPALSLGVGLVFNGPHWHGGARLRWYDDQTRNAPSETPTDGYTTLNANAGYRFVRGAVVHDFIVRLENVTDEEIRPHTSRLKDEVPLPGRSAGLIYKLVF